MGKNRKSSNDEKAKARILLALLFPSAFAMPGGEKKPLKIGIDKDIYARAKPIAPGLTRRILNSTMMNYVTDGHYLTRLLEGAARVDLDGNCSGVVTAHEAAKAIEQAELRRARARQINAEKKAAMLERKKKRANQQ